MQKQRESVDTKINCGFNKICNKCKHQAIEHIFAVHIFNRRCFVLHLIADAVEGTYMTTAETAIKSSRSRSMPAHSGTNKANTTTLQL